MSYYRKILQISYKDHVSNEKVCDKIQQAIGPHEDLLTIVKRRKLQWYGHVSRSSGLGQNHLARLSERGKKTSRQRKRWEDSIREWTGLDFGKSQRAVENREKWRKLVAESSVVPASTTLAAKELMMMMMMMMKDKVFTKGPSRTVCSRWKYWKMVVKHARWGRPYKRNDKHTSTQTIGIKKSLKQSRGYYDSKRHNIRMC